MHSHTSADGAYAEFGVEGSKNLASTVQTVPHTKITSQPAAAAYTCNLSTGEVEGQGQPLIQGQPAQHGNSQSARAHSAILSQKPKYLNHLAGSGDGVLFQS